MAEKQGRGTIDSTALARSETRFENVAEVALAMELDAATARANRIRGDGNAGIDCGLRVGWGFAEDELAGDFENSGLLAACSGKKRAHRNAVIKGLVRSWDHRFPV